MLEDHYNPRLVKELLQDLNSTLHSLTLHVGRCVLVGNVNIWLCRLETIVKWQQELNDLEIPKVLVQFLLYSIWMDRSVFPENQTSLCVSISFSTVVRNSSIQANLRFSLSITRSICPFLAFCFFSKSIVACHLVTCLCTCTTRSSATYPMPLTS